MATVTFDVPDALMPRLSAAVRGGPVAVAGEKIETDMQSVIHHCKQHLRLLVLEFETGSAQNTAHDAANAKVNTDFAAF